METLEIWDFLFLFILLNPSCFLSWFYSIFDHFVIKCLNFATIFINAFVTFLTAILTISINASVTVLTTIWAFFLTKTGLKKIFSAKIFLAVKYYDIFGFGPILLRAGGNRKRKLEEFYLNIFFIYIKNKNFRKFI